MLTKSNLDTRTIFTLSQMSVFGILQTLCLIVLLLLPPLVAIILGSSTEQPNRMDFLSSFITAATAVGLWVFILLGAITLFCDADAPTTFEPLSSENLRRLKQLADQDAAIAQYLSKVCTKRRVFYGLDLNRCLRHCKREEDRARSENKKSVHELARREICATVHH